MEDDEFMKVDGTNTFFIIKFNIIHGHITQSCLCIRRFWFYGNQPFSAMFYLFYSTLENEFTQDLWICGMISVGGISMSPIICSIWCVSMSCFLNKMNVLCSVLLYWVSYLSQWCPVRNTKNYGAFMILITYVVPKINIKIIPRPSTSSKIIILFPIILIQFQII